MEVSCLLEYERLPRNAAHTAHLLVSMETWPEEGGQERKPLNISLMLDKSGSMGGDKLEYTKYAAKALIDRLTSDDMLSVVAYDDRVTVVVPHGPVEDRDTAKNSIDSIEPGGSTNLSAGWLRGLGLVQQHLDKDFINRAILLTDGLANKGVTEQEALVEIATDALERGISTTTIGVGEHFNEKDLAAIAQSGGGAFYFVGGPDEAPGVFVKEFSNLARVFGQNLELSLELDEGFAPPELLTDLQVERKDRTAVVYIGDVLERDFRQLLFKIDIPAHLNSETGDEGDVETEIGSVTIRYDAVRGKFGPRMHVYPLHLTLTDGELGDRAPEVARVVYLAESAKAKREALEMASKGDTPGAIRRLRRAMDLLDSSEGGDHEEIKREKEAIKKLVDELSAGRTSMFQKRAAAQAFDQAASRGKYASDAGPEVIQFSFSPEERERADDIVNVLESRLPKLDYTSNQVMEVVFMVKELVDNAIEHGCKGAAEPRIEVELGISRSYLKCEIEDNGPGFDYEKVLKECKLDAVDKGSRGRGLAAAKKLASRLSFNNKGNCVTAVYHRQALRKRQKSEVTVSPQGVGEVPVVKISGQLDSSNTPEFSMHLESLLKQGHNSIILELSELRYVSSTGMGAFVKYADACSKKNGKMVLVGMSKKVMMVTELLGIHKFFELADNIDDALKLL